MPKRGWECLNIDGEYYAKIRKIAKRRKMSIKSVVLDALEDKYPNDFPKEMI